MSILEDLTAAESMYASWVETGSPDNCSTIEAGLSLKQTRQWIADLRAGTATEADIEAAQEEEWDRERALHGWPPIGRNNLDEEDDEEEEDDLDDEDDQEVSAQEIRRSMEWGKSRLAVWRDHPEIKTLGELEARFFGYVAPEGGTR